MTHADWFILGVLLLSGIMSWFRGFIREAISLLAWGAAFVVTSKFYERLAYKLSFIDNEGMKKIVACVLLFVLTLFIVGLCGNLIRSLIHKVGLSATDRILGMAFGLIRGTLILCLILVFLQFGFQARILSFMEDEPFYRDSLFIPELERIVSWFFDYSQQNGHNFTAVFNDNNASSNNSQIYNSSNNYMGELKEAGAQFNSTINQAIDNISSQAQNQVQDFVNNQVQNTYHNVVDNFENALLNGTQGSIDLESLEQNP